MTTITVTASCEKCGWSVQMSGDNQQEVATFLRGQIMQHHGEQHPGRTTVFSQSQEPKRRPRGERNARP